MCVRPLCCPASGLHKQQGQQRCTSSWRVNSIPTHSRPEARSTRCVHCMCSLCNRRVFVPKQWLFCRFYFSSSPNILALASMQIMSLSPEQLSKGLVTCSTGNHALAFVWACGVYTPAQQAPSTIYLPTNASPAKLSRLLAQGANVCQFSEDCALAEVEARRVAEAQGLTYVSPYNDWEVCTVPSMV